MLLMCNQCQKSYFIDDQVYAMQGGAVCEQCGQALVPVPDGSGYAQSQWNQASGNAQWGQQPAGAQWNQQANSGQWSQQPINSQWNQPVVDAQWGQQPPADAQWNQQPAGAQWGQQPADAQWGQQPAGAQWGQQPADAQWGQQPPNAQWGQQPADAQWGQQPADAQWGQQPPNAQWGQMPPSDAQWAQMADAPKETVALMDSVEQENDVVRHCDDNERTMALSDWDPDKIDNNDAPATEDWGTAFGDVPPREPIPIAAQNGNSLVVGPSLEPGANSGMTRQIDASEVQKMYGDAVNPVIEFFRSIPMRYLIILGSVAGGAIIGFVIAAIVLTQPEEVEQVIRDDGEIVDINAPARARTFDDLAKEAKDFSPAFVPFDGPIAKEGSIVAVADEVGVMYDSHKIANIDEITSGGPFIEKLADAAKKDSAELKKPIIFLFAEFLPMSTVYRVMYSYAPTARKLRIGGTSHNGISTFGIHPCDWPDHGLFAFDSCHKIPIEVKISKKSVIMRRIIDADTLPLIKSDSTKATEISTEIIGSKIQFDAFNNAISHIKMIKTPIVIKTDGDVSFGVFLKVARHFYGNPENPNFEEIFVSKIPLI